MQYSDGLGDRVRSELHSLPDLKVMEITVTPCVEDAEAGSDISRDGPALIHRYSAPLTQSVDGALPNMDNRSNSIRAGVVGELVPAGTISVEATVRANPCRKMRLDVKTDGEVRGN